MSRLIFCLLFICFQGFAQTTTNKNSIFGVWHNNQLSYQLTLMLNADGSGEFDGEVISFTFTEKQLAVIIGTTLTRYVYVLESNLLTLSGGDLDGKMVFRREGEVPVTMKTGSNTASAGFSQTDAKLLGLWSGNGEMIEFRADGKCVYLGNTFPYQISQGHIILSTTQGNSSFGYAIKSSQLTLTANGQNVVYTRTPGSASQLHAQQSGNNKVVAPELVGQWCYMNMTTNSQTSRCITLNADGTYRYSSSSSRSVNTETVYGGTASDGADMGTWYVQGDRLFYNSQSSGIGSYQLVKRNHPKNVNDPMIVLDGEAYVTATLRDPWR